MLVDTHWVGGDPTALEVYGWASWNKDKAILGLRNPSDKPQQFYLDPLKPSRYRRRDVALYVKSVYGSNATFPADYQQAAIVTLQPLQTLVFEATPVK